MKKVLIASTNIGKINLYKPVLNKLNIQVFSLTDFNINYSPEEIGNTEEENAIIKAKFYYEKTGMPVLANDSGLYIDKFSEKDQPGLFIRRKGERKLSDEEMINVFSKNIEKVGGESLGHYNIGLAIIDKNGKLYSKNFKSVRYFISKPCKILNKGFPLNSLAFDKKTNKYLAEMTIKEREQFDKESFDKQTKFITAVLSN